MVKYRVIDDLGREYESISEAARVMKASKCHFSENMKRYGVCKLRNRTFRFMDMGDYPTESQKQTSIEDLKGFDPTDIAEFVAAKKAEEVPFVKYDFTLEQWSAENRYAIALFSDAHIEETVDESTVLGLNEYNIEIARTRIRNYFIHLVNCLKVDEVDALIFASLGDTISGYIHDELAQTNGLSPLEAIFEAQNLIYNGLRFICENTNLREIKFLGICGNHSRTTKKLQFANGYRMSYEWLMYRNIEKECKLTGLPITFVIPESEVALIDAPDGRRFLFMHGYQIKGSGTNTVCGIFPALNRLCMKYDRTFHQDRVFIGHFHSCTAISNAVVNGSIIGYSAFSLNNGFAYEEPAQMYLLYDGDRGEMLTRKIYCE